MYQFGNSAHGRRKKKLLIAFHFQFSSPAAWECDKCRESGLAKSRNCAFLDSNYSPRSQIVWARGSVNSARCPKSIITAQSLTFVEQFFIWKDLGGGFPFELDAKAADAILILEREWRAEKQNGQ